MEYLFNMLSQFPSASHRDGNAKKCIHRGVFPPFPLFPVVRTIYMNNHIFYLIYIIYQYLNTYYFNLNGITGKLGSKTIDGGFELSHFKMNWEILGNKQKINQCG